MVLQERLHPTAINSDGCTGDVAGALGCKKRGEGCELAGLTEATHGDFAGPPVSGFAFINAIALRNVARELLETCSARVTRQDAVDRDVERRHFIGECARETSNSRAQTVR